MQIKNAVYAQGAVKKEQYPESILPEIALFGRSNVGKSSLINCLINRKNLARTSAQPGKTQLINFYLCDESWYFVDLPGYGFAKASKTMVNDWQSLLEPYLINNKMLKCVCVLLDIRHEPSEMDKQMISFLRYYGIPYIIVATKADKFGKSKIKPMASKLANFLQMANGNVFPTSQNGYGKAELLNKLEQFLIVE